MDMFWKKNPNNEKFKLMLGTLVNIMVGVDTTKIIVVHKYLFLKLCSIITLSFKINYIVFMPAFKSTSTFCN